MFFTLKSLEDDLYHSLVVVSGILTFMTILRLGSLVLGLSFFLFFSQSNLAALCIANSILPYLCATSNIVCKIRPYIIP